MKNLKSYYPLYSDEDILVIVKNHNTYVIPDRANQEKNILIDILRADFGDNVLLLHRLDAGTGGIMLFAKNKNAQRILSADFENGKIEKYYIAITENKIYDQTVMLPIAKANHGKFNINFTSGKKAITSFNTLYTNDKNSLINCRLYTGRTHQIRIHLKALKAPLLQDFLYNKKIDDKRLTLFHYRLIFNHPVTLNKLDFTAPLSDFILEKLNSLGLNNKIMLI